MRQVVDFLKHKPILVLLIALPLAYIAELLHWGPLWVFILSAVSVIPLAALIGEGTESLAAYTNPRIGGLLNATLGNAAELIIAIVAIRAGLLELVKASITGSILGNLLFVMGLSMVVGGLRHGVQKFDRRQASRNAILLVLAVIALIIPSIFSSYIGNPQSTRVEALSIGTALIMIILYGLALLYSFRFEGAPLFHKSSEELIHKPAWSVRKALVILALATTGVVIASELLVQAVEPVMSGLGEAGGGPAVGDGVVDVDGAAGGAGAATQYRPGEYAAIAIDVAFPVGFRDFVVERPRQVLRACSCPRWDKPSAWTLALGQARFARTRRQHNSRFRRGDVHATPLPGHRYLPLRPPRHQ